MLDGGEIPREGVAVSSSAFDRRSIGPIRSTSGAFRVASEQQRFGVASEQQAEVVRQEVRSSVK